jgi:hypothetical protein
VAARMTLGGIVMTLPAFFFLKAHVTSRETRIVGEVGTYLGSSNYHDTLETCRLLFVIAYVHDNPAALCR